MKLQQRPKAKATYRLRPIIGYSMAVLVMGIGTFTYFNFSNSLLSSASILNTSNNIDNINSISSQQRSALLDSISPGGLSADSVYPVLWFDASDESTITLSGNNVVTWNDKSGTIDDLTVSKGNPQYTGELNYRTVVNFTNDEMEGEDAFNGNTTEMHTFFVCRENTASDNFLVSFNGKKTGNSTTPNSSSIFSIKASTKNSDRWYFDAGNSKTDSERCYTDQYLTSLGEVTLVSAYKSATAGNNGIRLNGSSQVYTSATAKNAFTQEGLMIGKKTKDHDFAELIVYDTKLSAADEQKVASYLGLKYGITLAHDYISANDATIWDTTANSGYNKNVAGIGLDVNSGLNQIKSCSSNPDSRLVIVGDSSEVQEGEFLVWGTDGDQMGAFGIYDFPPEIEGRIAREWKFNKIGNIGTVEIRFDLSNMGTVIANELQLLLDTDQDGIFSDETMMGGGIRTGAIDLGADIFAFQNITITGNIKISLGTSSKTTTTLPIDLLQFDAELVEDQVDLTWTTASEIDNDYFNIERTADMINWIIVDRINGAGNSTSTLNYSTSDYEPLKGVSYYRLKQTDFNGDFTYSQVRTVRNNNVVEAKFIVYPNPAKDYTVLEMEEGDISNFDIMLINMAGQVLRSEHIPPNSSTHRLNLTGLKTGSYIITIWKGDMKLQKKIIIEQY